MSSSPSNLQHDPSEAPGRCPCCNNPWARATGDAFAAILCATCEDEKKKEKPEGDGGGGADVVGGLSRSNMDPTVKPSDNFYRYANGGWMDSNPIPAEYPSWNTFLELRLKSQERLRDILTGLVSEEDGEESKAESPPPPSSSESTPEERDKLRAFYAASMDEAAIESDGVAPLRPLLDLCEETASDANRGELATNLGRFVSTYGVSPFLSVGASPDNKNSGHSLCQLYQGGLGLPDRDYYFDADKAGKREKYRLHVARMLYLLDNPTTPPPGEDEDENLAPYVEKASKIFELEMALADAHMTKTENRDPEATYNKMSVAELTSEVGEDRFDFASYLDAVVGPTRGSGDLGDVNVRNTAALKKMAEVVRDVDGETLLDYLRWHSVRSCARYMGESFVNEDFDFNERILSGTKEIKPRWKRAMEMIESALGEALGKLYCDRYFDASSKGRALDVVENVRASLEGRLKEVEWMTSDETREAALKKMSRFKVKIGFPDKWIDYTALDIKSGQSFLSMVLASRAFHHGRTVKEMNAPTDRQKWFMTPQTVNAYYHPSLNEIVFPAAILQPPFFDTDADDAVNYGSMGAVVGHEMTHGFDDKGRKFDADGNMEDWWTTADGEEYDRRVEVMVKQADAFEVHGQKVRGKLTCGENIADLGGLRLALRALRARMIDDNAQASSGTTMTTVDGFTPVQRFFLGWAQCWRQNITKERALQLVTLDPHGPNELRCNGPLSNMAEFHEAFGVEDGSPMFKPLEQRVDIW